MRAGDNRHVPLVYITGISASGKSSVLRELRSRGYEALGVDEDLYGEWIDRESGNAEEFPESGVDDIHEWFRHHLWALSEEKIAHLHARSRREGSTVFLCGVAAGDREVWKFFDVVCALVIDEDTIRRRIEAREDDFGKRPGELAEILGWNQGYAEAYGSFGATIVDATQPLPAVVDEILRAAGMA
jgi:hypothetical protein